MNAYALHHPGDNAAWRWAGSALAILALHAGVVALGIYLYREYAPPGVSAPAVMIDMAAVSASPASQQEDVAPGPEMQQAEAASAPPPEPEASPEVEKMIPPTPLQENAEVAAPPEPKIEAAPAPAQTVPDQVKPTPVKPKPVRAEVKKKPQETTPAPRTTAPQRAATVATTNSAASAGASRAAIASYNQIVQAQVQRFKQYPASARTGKSGKVTTTVTFTLSRSGQVLLVRLVGSSGHPALDAETVATIRRAQPFPAFPGDMKMASQSFSLPLSYNLQ